MDVRKGLLAAPSVLLVVISRLVRWDCQCVEDMCGGRWYTANRLSTGSAHWSYCTNCILLHTE